MLSSGILETGRDVRGQPYSKSHVLVAALDKARHASWLPCLAHQAEMNSLRGHAGFTSDKEERRQAVGTREDSLS